MQVVTGARRTARSRSGIDPRFPDAYWERGRAFAAKHDQGRAVADFNQAIKINANYADPYNGRGLIHHQRGEFDAAIADFSEAKQLVWVFPPLSPIRGFDRRNKRRETWAGRGATPRWLPSLRTSL
jgi:tetratricopeptide (TPR) repeat protein